MKRYLLIGAGALLALLVIAFTVRGGHKRNTASKGVAADTLPVVTLGPQDVAPARKTDLVAGVPVSGTLKPSVDIRIASPVPEVVEQVLVKEGQAVRAGQTLARFRMTALEPAAMSADAQRRLAAADYDRMQNLYKEGAVSQHDVENAEVSLRAAEASAALAQKKLDEATVRASVSGVVSEKMVESGDRVKDGDELFRLVNTSELEFQATVPAEFATQVRPGDPVALTITGLADATIAGHVARVNATVDPATRQLKVYVSVPNQGSKLVGGLFASGRVVLRQVRGAIAVPAAAVKSDSAGGKFVFVVADGRVARRAVTTGAVDEQASLVEIKTGLAGGETVIVGPTEGLVVGQTVKLIQAEG
ncbi:MAG TPA: efflux RND transporter periplasmic adaptor subunit [Gemmatimonadales bacterium]|nr:efflux RND transporter periplasmic adaptor subunit [Gemmatimonadales bacterium]